MEYIPVILTVALIHLLAIVTPGPDFIMILRNSLLYGRRNGAFAAIGLGLGVLLHVTYCLLGVALIISRSILLFSIIKYVGTAYLIYIGIKSLRAQSEQNVPDEETGTRQKEISPWRAVRTGFITNATNPKATLFFLSVFTLVIKPTTPLWPKLAIASEMTLVTALWFVLVASIVSLPPFRKKVTNLQHYAERTMGGILILFGLKLGTAHIK